MQGDHPAAQPLVLQGLAQHPGRDDRLAVVGEAERAGVAQVGHLGQLVTAEPTRDRREKADRYGRLAARTLHERAQDGRVVDGRDRVRHRDQRAEPAGGRRRGAGGDRLLVLLAGGPQMDMGVDECGEEVLAGALDGVDLVLGGTRVWRRQLGDPSVADQHVVRLVDVRPWVEHVGPADQQLGAGVLGREQPRAGLGGAVVRAAHHATAASIGGSTSSS